MSAAKDQAGTALTNPGVSDIHAALRNIETGVCNSLLKRSAALASVPPKRLELLQYTNRQKAAATVSGMVSTLGHADADFDVRGTQRHPQVFTNIDLV